MQKSLAPELTGNFVAYEAGHRREAAARNATAGATRSHSHVSLSNRFAAYATRQLRAVPPLIFTGLLGMAMFIGWRINEEGHLTAESGIGYWLGIVGSLAMLALLLYPLRKRLGQTRWLGSVASWFRLHMMLGMIGPALILVHCNFKAGSLNSTVALVAMLLVAGSGIAGRYFYGRIHMGLYGRKVRVQEILSDCSVLNEAIGAELPAGERIVAALETHAARSMAAGLPARLLLQKGRSRRLRRKLVRDARRVIAEQGASYGWSRREQRQRVTHVREHLGLYFSAVDKAATFGVYDRLFAAWHIAHLPMFLLLVIAAIVHVVAVHLY